jgi:hypothetical protein
VEKALRSRVPEARNLEVSTNKYTRASYVLKYNKMRYKYERRCKIKN